MRDITRHNQLTFLAVWLGQTISMFGSGLTSFALGVWVYQQTGLVTQYALISVFTVLPGIILAPIAGVCVDRWDRRWVMILGDFGNGISFLAIAFMLFAGRLEVWHIYLAASVSSACRCFLWPAYTATISLLVPKKHYGRANGIVSLADASGRIVSPPLAALLLTLIPIYGVVLLNVASAAFSLVMLLIVRFPRPESTIPNETKRRSLVREAVYGWNYITARKGLLSLLIYFAITNFLLSIVEVLITPLVLSFASPSALSVVLSSMGVGMLIGGLVMSVWGGPRRRMNGVYTFMIVTGIATTLGGFSPSILLIASSMFLYMFCEPIINGCSQAIWQSKVAPSVQGRVFSFRGMIALFIMPLAYLIAGPLADRLFEPWLLSTGALAGSVGHIIGLGPGRGIGFLFIIVSIAALLNTFVAYLYPHLRHLEDELPDAVTDEAQLHFVPG